MENEKQVKTRHKSVKTLSPQEAKRLFLIASGDISLKGLNIKALPKSYPLSINTLYRMKNGKATQKTIDKVNNLLVV